MVQENRATCCKVDTSRHHDIPLNANGSEYYGAFKVCVPADNVMDNGNFAIRATNGAAWFNLFPVYNPAATEQSYIVSDPGYTTCDAQMPFAWTTMEELTEKGSSLSR